MWVTLVKRWNISETAREKTAGFPRVRVFSAAKQLLRRVLRVVCESALSSLAGQEMPGNADAPANDAPGSELDPAPIKLSNQRTKLGQARSEEPAPTKLNEQDNTHAVPVRALVWPPRSPLYAATC